MVNAYIRCVDEQEARAGVEEIDGMTGSGENKARGVVMVR
jgi:hypothetical protein